MSHEPQLPQASQSPYPLHPDPIPEWRKAEIQAEQERAATRASSALRPLTIGVAAIIGIGAASLTSGFIWWRRKKAHSQPARSARGKSRTKHASRAVAPTGDEQYGVTYFARKHGITAAIARAVLAEAGSNRSAANALAKRRKTA